MRWDESDLAAMLANQNIKVIQRGKSRGKANRGMSLEKLVEEANSQYMTLGEAFIWKPGTQVRFLPGGVITPQKTTVDFIGCLQGGLSIAFDCKSTEADSLPAGNVEEHQIDFLQRHWVMDGISFLLVGYMSAGRFFVVQIRDYLPLWLARTGLTISKAEEIGREVSCGRTCLDFL